MNGLDHGVLEDGRSRRPAPRQSRQLPDRGWGEMILTNSEPRSGTRWTDNGPARQRRELKHRPPGETRAVPIHPSRRAPQSDHSASTGGQAGGSSPARAAASSTTGPTSRSSTRPAPPRSPRPKRRPCWPAVLTTCGTRPYRPGSTPGCPHPRSPSGPGHSVGVLLRVYAKCITGQQEEAKRRIEEATRPRERRR